MLRQRFPPYVAAISPSVAVFRRSIAKILPAAANACVPKQVVLKRAASQEGATALNKVRQIKAELAHFWLHVGPGLLNAQNIFDHYRCAYGLDTGDPRNQVDACHQVPAYCTA